MKTAVKISGLILIIAIMAFPDLRASVIDVCQSCEYHQIRPALKAAKAGDTIVVHSGVYREGRLIIDKPLYFKGVGRPVLDGENKTEILTITSDNVTVEGFEIRNVGTDYLEDRAGIRVKNSKYWLIRDNVLLNTFFGIYLEKSSRGTIAGNLLEGEAVRETSSGNAIHLWYCKHVIVENNTVRGHRDGIYFEFVDNSVIRNNLSEDNLRYGLHFMFSNDDSYYQNTFRRNGAGVAVMFSRRIEMRENLFEHNWGKSSYGLLLKEIYDGEIENNTFRKNTIAIFVEGSNRINYVHNDFVNNGWAINISGGCLENSFNHNNFISNTFSLSIKSRAQENLLQNNFWDDYSGYDLDRDGIGDVPHRPVKLFNYVVNQTPEAIVLLRSLFVDLMNFSEKVSPIFTPADVMDSAPLMSKIDHKPQILTENER